MDGHPVRIGKYDIEGVIGEGGMGVVYRGRDPLIDRVVAIKTIRSDNPSDREELLQRLRMEARSAGKLQHPNIVVVHDFGEEQNLTYLVMEYVEGRNLARIIKSGTPMPFATKVDIILQLCQGLDYAHGLNVTHRDIKPGNIAVTARGTAKILDFGLARIDSARLTKTGFTSGTVAYMSPERMRGDSGPSDDVFALGAVAYELLTYKRAFPGTSYSDVVTKVLSDQFPKPPSTVADLPPELDPIVLRAMARNVRDRYQTPGEFAKALDEFRQTIAYQEVASRDADSPAQPFADEAGISSTANPYSAGSMTPAPAADALATREVAQSQGLGPDDKTMETRVGDLSTRDEGEKTEVRESGSMIPARTEPEQAVPLTGGGGEPEHPRTEQMPSLPGGRRQADSHEEKTQIGGTAIRMPGRVDAPQSPRDQGPPAAPSEAEPTSRMRTAVMKVFGRSDRAPDVEPDEKTIIDEGRAPGKRQPAAAAAPPVTARTAAYAPGAKPHAEPAPPAKTDVSDRHPKVVRVRKGGALETWLPAGALLLCVVGAALLGHVGGIPVYLAIYIAAVLSWILLLRRAGLFTLKQALVLGLLLRVGLLFIPPVIAADSLRGLWDGRMVANGLNPYLMAPLANEVTLERPAWFSLLAAPGDPTTTPPWALLMFMIVAWVGGGLFVWKLILLLVELLTIRLLSREKTGHAMMLYATCPLIALEGIWNARVEIIVIAFLVAASLAARRRSELGSGVLAGIGVGTSLLALPALPALWGTAERMIRMIVVTVVTAAVPLAIFATGGRIAESLRDLLFGPQLSGIGLVWLTERIEQARLAESITSNASRIAWEPLASALQTISAPDIAATLVGAMFLIVLIVVTKRSSGPDAAVANCLAAFFLLTAVFVPAGWLLLVPFAIAARQSLWILYALITPLAYLLPEEGTSWMLLATLYALAPILWLIFRDEDGAVHLFDSAAGEPVPEPVAHVKGS